MYCNVLHFTAAACVLRLLWRRGDLLAALHEVEGEEDINKVLRYFSYEHFYVIYCKFWDLDQGGWGGCVRGCVCVCV